ncbi:MAG: beta-lactamase family protein [Bacteroidetes bacterium]|nr:beta-lactamase family protein [Bacteroidota bacterium]
MKLNEHIQKGISICALLLLLNGCGGDQPEPQIEEEVIKTKADRIDSLLKVLHSKGRFNATVLVAEGSEIIYQNGFGYANFDTKDTLSLKSCFRLASVSKQFTAMCVMILEEREKLSYDDDITKYLPELSFYEGVTVRHLLWHTGGLPDYMQLFEDHWDTTKLAFKEDILSLMAEHQPEIDFKPGEKYEYSNTGYSLLAGIVQRASGVHFDDFITENLFMKINMSASLVCKGADDEPIPNRVFGYYYDESSKSMANADYHYLNGVIGDGGLYSTIGDLFKWDQALYTEQLVSKATLDLAFTGFKLNDADTLGDYGFGWGLYKNDSTNVVSHSGSWVGFSTYIQRDIGNKTTIIVLNNTYDRVYHIVKMIESILKEEPIKMRDKLKTFELY